MGNSLYQIHGVVLGVRMEGGLLAEGTCFEEHQLCADDRNRDCKDINKKKEKNMQTEENSVKLQKTYKVDRSMSWKEGER